MKEPWEIKRLSDVAELQGRIGWKGLTAKEYTPVHRVRFDDPLLGKLLMYMLFAQDADGTLSRHFSGAGIQHLTGQALARLQMPLPPQGEREQIIAKIEAMLAISEEAERLYEAKLSALDALKQSLLHRAFSGELAEREPLAA